MKHAFKILPGSIREIEATYDNKEFLNFWQPIYDSAIANVHLKGFRPGTAPKDMADKAIDKEEVFHQAATAAIRSALKQISTENFWEIIDQPQIEILESPDGLKFKATITLFPEIKLGNYKKIAKSVMKEKKQVKIEEGEVQKTIEWVLKSRAQIIKVNREAQKGDVVDIVKNGEKDHFVLGEAQLKDGIEEKIIGHKEGDKFNGVELTAVFERKIPELNDEFVKGLGNFQTVADFDKSVREGILKEKQMHEVEALRMKMINEIVKDSKIDMAKVLVERTLDNMIHDYQEHLHHLKGNPSGDELREKLRSEAENRVASSLVIHQIVKDEKLEPTQAEVEAEANKFLSTINRGRAAEIDKQKIYDYSYDIIKNKKVFDFLEGSA